MPYERSVVIPKGKRFGRLVTVKEIEPVVYGRHTFWRVHCKCDCGATKDVLWNNLQQGKTTSCGCHRIERIKEANTKHGLTYKHPLYGVWAQMKRRCDDPKHKYYKDYGGRGIQVCKEWRNNFQAFYDWAMLLPPSIRWQKGLEIDRRDTNGDYSPDNCRFSDRRDNCLNKRNNIWVKVPRQLTRKQIAALEDYEDRYDCNLFKNGKMLLEDLWWMVGQKTVKYDTVIPRVRQLGWDAWEAVTTPSRRQ